MKTVEVKLYEIRELNADAKEMAIDAHRYDHVNSCDWYDHVKDEYKSIGLDITSFDCDRAWNAKLNDHGLPYSIATKLIAADWATEEHKLAARAMLALPDDESAYGWNGPHAITKAFLETLEELILKELRAEYEYQTSDEYVTEYLECNGIYFTEEGELFNA